jgi:hypothetical protein
MVIMPYRVAGMQPYLLADEMKTSFQVRLDVEGAYTFVSGKSVHHVLGSGLIKNHPVGQGHPSKHETVLPVLWITHGSPVGFTRARGF